MSLFKINLYAARGPRHQAGSFYTDCQLTQRYDTNTRFFIVYHTLFNRDSTLHPQAVE